MRLILAFALSVILLSACANNDTVSPIHKADSELEPLETSAAIESEPLEQEAREIEEYAEFTIDGEIVSCPSLIFRYFINFCKP